MRTETVTAQYRCNQACAHCVVRRDEDDPEYASAGAVGARLDAAIASGARRIVIAGGEPALRSDLVELVGRARPGPEREVVLETNATPIDRALARALAAAGLRTARVKLSGASDAVDAFTRDRGGFARTLAGTQALRDAGIGVEVLATLVRSTRALVPDLPELLARLGVSALELSVPVRAPDPEELLDYAEAAPSIAATDRAARAIGLTVRLARGEAPPPCALPRHASFAHLFALSPGGARRARHRHVDACRECAVADRCPGFPDAYLDRRGTPPVEPIREDRVRRRLTLIEDARAQIAREMVTPNRREEPTSGPVEERIVRIQFACNQACRFCFVSTHLPSPADAAIRDAILDAGRTGARVAISGGEPTLNPAVVEWVALAKRATRHPVELQTNAVRLSDPALVEALAAAGLDEAFVSLHGATAETSDAITDAAGTFVKTVAGIDNLHRSRIRTLLNFVICGRNRHEIVPFVEMVAARWPRIGHLTFSFVAASSDLVPRDEDLIPRYAEVLPALGEAMRLARTHRIRIGGFQSMCGLPLCLVPEEVTRYAMSTPLPPDISDGEFLKPEPCRSCRLESRCYGIRRGYAAIHGTSELRPL